MPGKVRNPTADYAVYLVIRCGLAILQALPVRLAFAGADWLAWLAYQLDHRHRAVAAENLKFAFPEKTKPEIDNLVRGCYRHFLRLVVEIALLPRKFRHANWRRWGRMVNGGAMVAALIDRRPTLIVTAHFGNWE